MILADTGFFVALANPRDHWHRSAVQALGALRRPLVTTWPVLTETCHLLLSRLGPTALSRFIESANKGAFRLVEMGPTDLPRIEALMKKYAALPMDLADASLVVAAERLGHGEILSTDRRDFGAYRWKNRKPFKNLLPDP